MARNLHKYEELTPWEFDQEKAHASIIYAAVGPVEFHEESSVLGFDPCKAYQWCLDAAAVTGGIVFPMIPFAPDGPRPFMTREQIRERAAQPCTSEYCTLPGGYPGIYSSRELCWRLYKELMENFAVDLKFKLCVFLGGHQPAGNMLKDIVMEVSGPDGIIESGKRTFVGTFKGMRIMAVGSLDYNRDLVADYYEKNGIKRVQHGGLWETAINYAINPEYFQEKYLDETKYPQHYGALKDEYFEGCLRPVKTEYKKLTPEFARLMYDTSLQRMIEAVKKNYCELV